MVLVIPRPSHLQELREEFDGIGILPDKKKKILQVADAFTLDSEQVIETRKLLSPEEASLVIQMTPNARHVSPENRLTDPLLTTLSFEVITLSKL